MRLIYADSLKKSVEGLTDCYNGFSDTYDKACIIGLIDEEPTVDAVEVVRCGDCKWGKETCGNIECFVDLNAPSEYHGYNWFCPNGEKR